MTTKTNKTAVPPARNIPKGTYLGEELKVNPGLPPERMEAYYLPSLWNGRRVYPKRQRPE